MTAASQARVPATGDAIRRIAAELRLDRAAYLRARELAGLERDAAGWPTTIERFLLIAGVALICAGLAAFFAYNWSALPKFAKLGAIEIAVVACVAVAAWRPDAAVGRSALFAAAFLVGVLFAVYGQIYQTGADPYGLFVVWGLTILPWVAIGRQAALWLLLWALGNLAVILYWTQVLEPRGLGVVAGVLGPLVALAGALTDTGLATLVFALNAAALIAWEHFARRGVAWLSGRTAPRVIAGTALAAVVAATLIVIAGGWLGIRGVPAFAAPAAYAGFAALALWYYRDRVRDLPILTATLAGGIMIVTALVGRIIGFSFDVMLLLAILVVAQTAAAAWWLRRIARRTPRSP
jgi:uncharacterized membrane protein